MPGRLVFTAALAVRAILSKVTLVLITLSHILYLPAEHFPHQRPLLFEHKCSWQVMVAVIMVLANNIRGRPHNGPAMAPGCSMLLEAPIQESANAYHKELAAHRLPLEPIAIQVERSLTQMHYYEYRHA